MNTPWRALPVSDAHIHFLSRRFYETLATQKGSSISTELSSLGIEAPGEDGPEELASRWVSELDLHGLQSAALIASVPGDEASVVAAVRAFPAYNLNTHWVSGRNVYDISKVRGTPYPTYSTL